ncbi:MAG: YoaK family protein [Bacillota bacterium]|nr:YoaK family protein [Bacillota bacterium]
MDRKIESIDVQKQAELSPVSKESSVGFVLIFVAGWINIQGIKLGLIDSLSYMTGRGVRIGTAMFEGDPVALMYVLVSLAAFIFGSYFGARVTAKKGIGQALLLTASFLAIVASAVTMYDLQTIPDESAVQTISKIFVILAMGTMNGATSMTRVGRTTHLTGTATDIGLNLALGKKKTALFHLLRWVGFFMGAFVAICFHVVAASFGYPRSILAWVPTVIVAAEGVLLTIKKDRIQVIL